MIKIQDQTARSEPKRITRAELATQVEIVVRGFILQVRSTINSYSPLSNLTCLFQSSFYNPMTPGFERWKIGPGFIEAKDLVLVRLVHVSCGSWQPELRTTGPQKIREEVLRPSEQTWHGISP